MMSSQRGFTLLEMLLAVGVIGALMVMVSRVSTEIINQRVAQTAGQQLAAISQISEDVVLRSADGLWPNTSELVTGKSGLGQNIYTTLANNNYVLDGGLLVANSKVEVMYGMSVAGATGPSLVRVITVLKKPYPLAQAVKIARAAGSRGALIRPDVPGVISGAFNNWRYTMASAVSQGLTNAGLAPIGPGEAYVLSYRTLSQSDVLGPYLNKYGTGGRNVMFNDLLMNGNSIIAAKDIDVGTMSATKAARFDQLAVNGDASFQGGIDAGDNVTVKGNLNVSQGDLNVTNGDLKVPGGNVSAKGLRADTLDANDLTTKDITTKTLRVDGGDTLITSNLAVSGGSSLDITGPLKATVVDAETITTKTMKTSSMSVKENATLAGETTINNTAKIDQLVLDGCMVLDNAKYGTCK